MRRLRYLLSLLAILSLAAPFRASATNGTASYAGGAFSTGTAAGQSITVKAAPLANSSGTLSFGCPITAYTAGTYALNWTCAGGTVTITSTDDSIAFHGVLIAGSMSYTSSGGGRGGHVSAIYQFNGSFSGTVTAGKVTQFAYGSLAQAVDTGGQIGTSTAPVSSGSLGWNSGFSPLLIGDALNSRVLGVDNIAGANLFAIGAAGSGVYEFGKVAGLAQDASLRIYATDSTLDRVVRADGKSLTGWTTLGSAGEGANHFSQPQGIAVDGTGKIWVADTGNNRVVRFDDMTGTNWTEYGSLGAGVNHFSSPASIAFDPQGRVYVADTGNNRLVRFDDITGKNWTTLTQVSVGATTYPLTGPASVATNAAGQVYLALASGYLVRVNDITGANGSLRYWGGALTALSIDKSGTVYVAGNFTPGIAQALDADANGYFASSLGSTSLQVSALLALATPQPPPAEGVLSPAVLNFGSQNVGVPTPSQAVTLLNLGASPLILKSISRPPDYQGTTQCPAIVAPGTSCTGTMLFRPTTTGSRNGTLALGTNGAHPEVQVILNGTGTAPNPVFLPASLSFDPQRILTTSGTQTVTMTNAGSGPLRIKTIQASAGFKQTSNCVAVIAAGNGCTLEVSFNPTTVGSLSGSLTISDDAVVAGAQQVIPLTGAGVSAAPSFVLSPESLQFPNEQVGTTSGPQSITLTNSSGTKVSLSASSYPAMFNGSSDCGPSLANGASCTYSVQFTPTRTTSVTGNLKIPITGFSAISVGLSGTGVAAGSAATLSATPDPIAFGSITVGDNPSLSTILLNTSSLTTGVRSVALSGDSTFSMTKNNCSAILAPNATCTIEINFVPLATSAYLNSGTLLITESTGAVTQVPVSGYAVPVGAIVPLL